MIIRTAGKILKYMQIQFWCLVTTGLKMWCKQDDGMPNAVESW